MIYKKKVLNQKVRTYVAQNLQNPCHTHVDTKWGCVGSTGFGQFVLGALTTSMTGSIDWLGIWFDFVGVGLHIWLNEVWDCYAISQGILWIKYQVLIKKKKIISFSSIPPLINQNKYFICHNIHLLTASVPVSTQIYTTEKVKWWRVQPLDSHLYLLAPESEQHRWEPSHDPQSCITAGIARLWHGYSNAARSMLGS